MIFLGLYGGSIALVWGTVAILERIHKRGAHPDWHYWLVMGVAVLIWNAWMIVWVRGLT